MKRNRLFNRTYFIGILSFFLIFITFNCDWCNSPDDHSQFGWPIDPMNTDHKIGNSAGEFQAYADYYVHTGLDILIPEPYPHPNSPYLKAVRDGKLWFFKDPDDIDEYHSLILDVDEIRYYYGHIDKESIRALWGTTFVENGESDIRQVDYRDSIGHVVEWRACSFNHIHFMMKNRELDATYNPLLYLSPRDDDSDPKVENITFSSQGNPAVQFTGSPNIQVSGLVDITAEISDTLFSSHNTGIYSISCIIKKSSDSGSEISFSYTFDQIHRNDDVHIYDKETSRSDYCGVEVYYYIVTNIVDGKIDDAGVWDTTSFEDGLYEVEVIAKDVSGNEGSNTVTVEVDNH
jgi:hypothetical protein